ALQFVVSAPLELAIVPLAQPRVQARLEAVDLGNRLGSLARAHEVAGVQHAQRPVGEAPPGARRLRPALVVERDVDLPLESSRAVPGRDSVTDQHRFGVLAFACSCAQAEAGVSLGFSLYVPLFDASPRR